jgi:XTP/dITP diphosphohydrolase
VKVLLATANSGKIGELKAVLAPLGGELIGLGSLATSMDIETGATFEENALIKARYYHEASGMITIADDSGLEVEALGGAPGVRSARYGGTGASDAGRTARLLEALNQTPTGERAARFRCAAAIVWDAGERVFSGSVEGVILTEPRGAGGFGYDPVFFYPPLGKTFAELDREQKWEISHRGIAFRRLTGWLVDAELLVDTGG